MLKLKGWGLRPWMEFEIDPLSGRYEKGRLESDPTMLHGYAGFAQELRVTGLGVVLCSVFVHEDEMVIHMGSAAWNLFEPGLAITHRRGALYCQLALLEPSGKHVTYRYRRKDLVLAIIDSTYDDLDFEQAHLPAALPSPAQRNRGELVAEWSARMTVQPAVPPDGPRPAGSACR
jgi:hypothetical protein